MTVIGVYRPGNTLLHRLSPGIKILLLAASMLVISLTVRTLPALGITVAGVAVVYAIAGIGPVTAWRQLRPMLWILLFVFACQWLFTDWQRALVLCGVIAASVALAAVITLTTRTDDLLDSLNRGLKPLARFGVPVEHLSMGFALAIRSIPLMVEIVRHVEEARKARGLRPGPRILVAPIVIGALATADGFAETLTARGMD